MGIAKDLLLPDVTSVVAERYGIGCFLYESPLWSSDGAFIAYALGDLTGGGQTTWDVAVYDLAQKESTVLLNGNAFGPRYIAWVPKTHDLIFNARIIDRTGTSGFRRIDIAAPGEQTLFFDDRGEELQPSVSADGSSPAYMQLDNGIGNIYTAYLADGSIKQLTRNQLTGSSPAWAPDGETIFFLFYGEGAFNIWSVDPDDGELVQLTFGTQDMYPFAGYMYALVP